MRRSSALDEVDSEGQKDVGRCWAVDRGTDRGREREGRVKIRLEQRLDGEEEDGGSRVVGRFVSSSVLDIPFEFVGKVSGACAVAEASHVERLATTRHIECLYSMQCMCLGTSTGIVVW